MDYTATLEQLKEWACDLLILQYRQAPKNRAFIKTIANLIFADLLPLQIRDLCLNVDKSVGVQLDVVGKWVGVDRYYNSVDLWNKTYTALVNYSNVSDNDYENHQGGFSSFPTFLDGGGGFLTYQLWQDTRTAINQMGDDYFRQIIKLKIIKNSINCTNKNIDDAIWKWSEGKVYTTWGVMEVTYHYPQDMANTMFLAAYKDVLPAPTGCTVITTQY